VFLLSLGHIDEPLRRAWNDTLKVLKSRRGGKGPCHDCEATGFGSVGAGDVGFELLRRDTEIPAYLYPVPAQTVQVGTRF